MFSLTRVSSVQKESLHVQTPSWINEPKAFLLMIRELIILIYVVLFTFKFSEAFLRKNLSIFVACLV